MGIINNLCRFIQRKRHSAGFGVHSEFAFNLILDTIHTPHAYYAYQDNFLQVTKSGLKEYANFKYAELLFRLVNRFSAKSVLEIGAGFGINTLYFTAFSKDISVTCIEQSEDKIRTAKLLLSNYKENIIFIDTLPIQNNRSFDTIVWDLKLYSNHREEIIKTVSKTIKDDGFIVVNHINLNRENRDTWQKILQLDKLTMSFDLGAIGIGFFRSSLPKLNYDLYF